MQGQEPQSVTGRGLGTPRQALTDLRGPRKEDEGMAPGALVVEPGQGLVHPQGERTIVEPVGGKHVYRIQAPLAVDPQGIQVGHDRIGLQGGAHDDEPEIGTGALKVSQQGQG